MYSKSLKKKAVINRHLVTTIKEVNYFFVLFLLVYDILRSSVKEGNLYGELAIRFYEICCSGE